MNFTYGGAKIKMKLIIQIAFKRITGFQWYLPKEEDLSIYVDHTSGSQL